MSRQAKPNGPGPAAQIAVHDEAHQPAWVTSTESRIRWASFCYKQRREAALMQLGEAIRCVNCHKRLDVVLMDELKPSIRSRDLSDQEERVLEAAVQLRSAFLWDIRVIFALPHDVIVELLVQARTLKEHFCDGCCCRGCRRVLGMASDRQMQPKHAFAV